MANTFTLKKWNEVLAICKSCPFYVWADTKCVQPGVDLEFSLDPKVVTDDPICPVDKWNTN
jgi:hypothetical protein